MLGRVDGVVNSLNNHVTHRCEWEGERVWYALFEVGGGEGVPITGGGVYMKG